MKTQKFIYYFKIICLLSILFFCQTLVMPSFAQETASPSPDDPSDDVVEEKIKESWSKFIDEGVDKIKGITEELKKSKIYSCNGNIKTIEENSLKLETAFGEKEVKVATDAAIANIEPGKPKKVVDFEFLKTDQFIIAIGFKSENEVLDARRIVITPKTDPPSKPVIFISHIGPEE